MKTYRVPGLALFALLFAPGLVLGQALPVATPVDPATLTAPADPGLPAPALLIAVLVPLLIAGLKKVFPKIPGASVAALCFLCGLLFLAPACTTFKVEQGDVSPEREIIFKLSGRAWFSGQQAITQLKAIQTDKSRSFGTDSISNKGPTKLLNAAKP